VKYTSDKQTEDIVLGTDYKHCKKIGRYQVREMYSLLDILVFVWGRDGKYLPYNCLKLTG
jgi:hypothetical protein